MNTGADASSLFTAQRDRVRRALVRIVGEAEADDLTQEVFMRATRALPDFRGEAAVSTWLLRIARGIGLDYLRSRRHREVQRTVPFAGPTADEANTAAAATEPSEAPAALRGLVRREMSACIREYVTRLAPEHRVVIELKDLEGLSNAEIATRLGVSVGAAKIRLHRARQMLRRELERGCEFYRDEESELACDRKKPASAAGLAVSPSTAISSKEVRPAPRARRATAAGRNNTTKHTSMNIPSDYGCAAPAAANACATPPAAFSPIAAEYVALGAAIGANCEPCLRYHVAEALKVGISAADIAKAVATAAKVKETPARNILKLAERLLQPGGEAGAGSCAAAPSATGCGCTA